MTTFQKTLVAAVLATSIGVAVHQTRTKESIVGYLFSTSFCSRKALGDNADAFAADMAESLSKIGSSFEEEWIFGCTIGQNPQR